MDALALLCNLHADGPLTLHKLRERGCASTAQLLALPRAELILVLGGTPAAAERFLREARLLDERVGQELLAEEEHLGLRPEAPQRAPESGLPPGAARREHYAGRPMLDAVLEVWRERDALSPPASFERPPAAPPEEVAPRTGAAPETHWSESQRQALARARVRELAELLAADPLELARATGLGFTEVLRLQFLARRAKPCASPTPEPDSGAPFASISQAAVAGRGASAVAPETESGSAGPFA